MGKDEREGNNERHRQITFYSFRRFVKTTTSDLGYADYSEYLIGHSGSTYWRKKESKKADIFQEMEPYLAFLNTNPTGKAGCRHHEQGKRIGEVNQSLRERDTRKDDTIAMISDQFLTITERRTKLERKQQFQ